MPEALGQPDRWCKRLGAELSAGSPLQLYGAGAQPPAPAQKPSYTCRAQGPGFSLPLLQDMAVVIEFRTRQVFSMSGTEMGRKEGIE